MEISLSNIWKFLNSYDLDTFAFTNQCTKRFVILILWIRPAVACTCKRPSKSIGYSNVYVVFYIIHVYWYVGGEIFFRSNFLYHIFRRTLDANLLLNNHLPFNKCIHYWWTVLTKSSTTTWYRLVLHCFKNPRRESWSWGGGGKI